MTGAERTRIIKDLAAEIGFDRCGIAPADAVARGTYYRAWLARGRAGSMAYLDQHVEKRLDAGKLLPGARAVVVVALNYHQPTPAATGGPVAGRIARYAWGEDYHIVLRDKLHALADGMRARFGEAFETKCCVDTAPLLEREYAMRAGIGWIGKNTLVLHQDLGSYFVLGEVVTTLELRCDAPAVDHCGTCTRCLEACPTDAFPAAYEMDASRCISYLTIEHRGEELPAETRGKIGPWLFGCDVCQEVCPFNREAPAAREERFVARPPAPAVALDEVLAWTPEDYQRSLKGSAMKRAKLPMLQRNARAIREAHHKDADKSGR
jgi:epoxyqueuosine reductase